MGALGIALSTDVCPDSRFGVFKYAVRSARKVML
jgi:hypothetical protein